MTLTSLICNGYVTWKKGGKVTQKNTSAGIGIGPCVTSADPYPLGQNLACGHSSEELDSYLEKRGKKSGLKRINVVNVVCVCIQRYRKLRVVIVHNHYIHEDGEQQYDTHACTLNIQSYQLRVANHAVLVHEEDNHMDQKLILEL